VVIGGIFSFGCPLSVWMRAWLSMPCNGSIETAEHEGDYYQAQHMWSKEMKYHKDQFIYKNLPEAKNPEMLSAGVAAVTKADDMKESYGVSAGKMADDATAGADESKVRMKGGRIAFGDDEEAGVPVSSTHSDIPAPTRIGASEAGDRVTVDSVPASEDPDMPLIGGAVIPGAPDPVSPPTSGSVASAKCIGRVTWEFEVSHGYTAFHTDCQAYIEEKWQVYKASGGRSRYNVRTQGFTVSIDFERMGSKREDAHKLRAVRRKES